MLNYKSLFCRVRVDPLSKICYSGRDQAFRYHEEAVTMRRFAFFGGLILGGSVWMRTRQ